MAIRVTADEVRTVTGEPAAVDPSLAITTASFWVDHLLATPLLVTDADQLKQIELYLAAHFLVLTTREGPLAAQAVDEASERYHDIYSPGLGATRFGQQAMMFDTTGTLQDWSRNASEGSPRKALFSLVGTPIPSDRFN